MSVMPASEAAARLVAWSRKLDLGMSGASLGSPYHETVAVFRCGNVIAGGLARVPLRLYRGEELVEAGPAFDLLRQPNPLMTQDRLVRTIALQAALSGDSHALIDWPEGLRAPRQIITLPTGSVSPIRPQSNPWELIGWRFRFRGNTVDLRPEEIARFEYAPDPNDPLKGVSPLAAARLVVETDYLAALYNRSVLENSGTPAGVLCWKGEDTLDDDQVSEVRRRWRETYGGPRNAEQVAVLSGLFEWQPTGVPLKDMQWLEARKWNLADIARAFNVPLVFLNEYENSGLSDAGLRVQERMLYLATIIPLAKHVEQVVTEAIVRRIAPTLAAVFDFDGVEALRQDTTQRLEHAKALATLGYPVNEINRVLELGMPDVPWGDVASVDQGKITAQAAIDLSMLPPVDVTAAAPPRGQPRSLLLGPGSPHAAGPADATPAGEDSRDASLADQPFALSPERMAKWRAYLRVLNPNATVPGQA